MSWAVSGLSVNYTVSNSLPATVTTGGPGLPSLTVQNYWDGLNRLTGQAFPDGTTTSNRFDLVSGVPYANGSGGLQILDPTAGKDRLGNWTYFTYDPLRHLTAVTNALMNVTQYSWCGCGALTGVLDPLNNPTTLNYDNQGNLTSLVLADNSSVTRQYDLAGRVTNVLDGSGRSLLLAYNNQGLVTKASSPYGTLWQANYDSLDRAFSTTDANGVTVTNGFDLLNRLTRRVWLADMVGESFAYASNGLVAYTNRDGKATLLGRDNAGRLTAATNANLEVTQGSYNALNQLLTLTDPLTHVTSWEYNQYGWLMSKLDTSNRVTLTLAHDADGNVTNRWTPAAGNVAYAFDAVGNLTNISYTNALYPTAPVSFAFDADNRLRNMLDALGGQTAFTYTGIGQLQSETGPWANDALAFGYTQGHRTSLSLAQPSGAAWTNLYVYDRSGVWPRTRRPRGTSATGIRRPALRRW